MARISKYDLLLIVLVSSVVFIGLGSSSLQDFDEGIYAQVSRQILQNHDWLTFTFGTEPWFEKPPVFMWATALLFRLFGVSEFWARAISAVSSVFVILLTYIIGSAVFNRRVGLLTVVPLLTGYEFLRQSRLGTMNMLLTLIIMMILVVYISASRKSPAFWYLLSVLFSLGFMVKFWAIFVVAVAIGIHLVLEKQVRSTLSCKHFWGATLVALVIILPWHLIMYFMHGQDFIDRYIIYDLVERTLGPLEGNSGSPRYYFDRLAYDYAPWFFLLPVALILELRRVIGKWDKSSTLLLFVACIFGIYSLFIGTKIFHYLTPIYPILAIFHASVIIQAYDNSRSMAFSGLVIASLIATLTPGSKTILGFFILSGLIILGLFIIRGLAPHLRAFLEAQALRRSQLSQWITLVSRALLAYLQTLYDGKGYPKLAVLLMCLFLAIPGVLRSRTLYDGTESPVEKISSIASASDILYDKTMIALALPSDYENAIAGPAAMFYSARPIRVAWSEEELFALTAEGPREIIMGEKYIDTLSDEYDFSILAESPPFIYGVVSQREQP